MKTIKAEDVPIGYRMFLTEIMDFGEIRETHYLRLPDGPTRYPNNVPVLHLRTIQGVPEERPRYDTGEFVSKPSELNKNIPMQGIRKSQFIDRNGEYLYILKYEKYVEDTLK